MKKFIKIAGAWVAMEVIFALGKGHMLSCVRIFDPETGDEIRHVIEEGMQKSDSTLRRMAGAVICKSDDAMTWLYSNRDQKEEGS